MACEQIDRITLARDTERHKYRVGRFASRDMQSVAKTSERTRSRCSFVWNRFGKNGKAKTCVYKYVTKLVGAGSFVTFAS